MKKITFIVLLVFSLIGNAVDAISQNTVTVSGSSNWVGYANVFGLDGTSFEFGSAWGLADVKSVVNVGANSITLSPNFNAYAAGDAYWSNGAIGNKIFEGNTFVENSALAGQVLTFSGNVVSNTLASGYTAVAFIKGLNPATGYSADVNVSVPLVSGQAFTLSTTTAIPSGLIVQYGFTIKGLNGNPANEVALGNVVVEASSAPPVSLTQMTLPVTFDDATVDYGLIGFGGAEASSVVVDPTLGSNKVVKVIKSGTAELWAGTTVTAAAGLGFSTKIPFTATETKMNVRVWSPNAGIQVRLKVEDHTNNGITCETEATVTTASGWQTLEFNFANQAAGTAALDITKNFDKASIFFNFGVTGATAGEKTYYFDDVKFGAAPSVPSTNDLVLPIDFESSAITYSFTDFDGGAATKIANPHSTGINTSANVAQIVKGAGAVWAGSYLTLPTPVDFSTNKIFKVKVWSPVAGKKLLLKFEGGASGSFEKESTPIAAANTWEELTFDFSAVGGVNNLNNKIVLIFDLGTAGDGSANSTYLLDDIVQTNTLATIDFKASKVSMYPNPTSSYLTIEANSTINRVVVYNILGQEVLAKSPKSNATTLLTAELKKGIYLVKTEVDGKVSTTKIIKE